LTKCVQIKSEPIVVFSIVKLARQLNLATAE